MIREENKELIFRTILVIILLIAVLILGIYFIIAPKNKIDKQKEKQENIPQIKEDFISTSIKKYKTYNNKITLNNSEIILHSNEENISHYIIGKYGVLFTNSIPVYIINENKKYNNYEVYYKDNKFYYIDKINNIISDYYEEIIPVKYNNEYNYLLLYKDKKYQILNINTHILNELDTNIIDINYNTNNNLYLIVKNNDKLYGLIDYNTNQILDFKYNYLSNYISNNKFIAKINNKYGIINNKEEILIDFINDNIIYNDTLNNYSIFIKDKKLGIYYKDKLVVNYKIDYRYNHENAIKYIVNDDILYLSILNNDYESMTNYIIDKNAIQLTTNKIYEPLYYNQELKYFYILNDNKITYYDTYYNELYSIELNKEVINIELIKENISQINTNKELYYIDLFNSKQIKEIDALYNYFDNGYSFTLNSNSELKIYKNKELISTYNNIDLYLGNYYFLSNNYNEETNTYESIIYDLRFNKKN